MDALGERGDSPGDRGELLAWRPARRTGGARAEEGAATEGTVGVDRAAPALKQRTATFGPRDDEHRRAAGAARGDRALEARPLHRADVRLAAGALEVTAVRRCLA